MILENPREEKPEVEILNLIINVRLVSPYLPTAGKQVFLRL